MPKPMEKKVASKGTCTVPPSASALNTRPASSALGSDTLQHMPIVVPSKLPLGSSAPISSASSVIRAACITRSALSAGVSVPGSTENGRSTSSPPKISW